jgi:hypothetical protein
LHRRRRLHCRSRRYLDRKWRALLW